MLEMLICMSCGVNPVRLRGRSLNRHHASKPGYRFEILLAVVGFVALVSQCTSSPPQPRLTPAPGPFLSEGAELLFTFEQSVVRKHIRIGPSSNPAVRTRKVTTRLCHGSPPF